jgi:hypothetical protein
LASLVLAHVFTGAIDVLVAWGLGHGLLRIPVCEAGHEPTEMKMQRTDMRKTRCPIRGRKQRLNRGVISATNTTIRQLLAYLLCLVGGCIMQKKVHLPSPPTLQNTDLISFPQHCNPDLQLQRMVVRHRGERRAVLWCGTKLFSHARGATTVDA